MRTLERRRPVRRYWGRTPGPQEAEPRPCWARSALTQSQSASATRSGRVAGGGQGLARPRADRELEVRAALEPQAAAEDAPSGPPCARRSPAASGTASGASATGAEKRPTRAARGGCPGRPRPARGRTTRPVERARAPRSARRGAAAGSSTRRRGRPRARAQPAVLHGASTCRWRAGRGPTRPARRGCGRRACRRSSSTAIVRWRIRSSPCARHSGPSCSGPW